MEEQGLVREFAQAAAVVSRYRFTQTQGVERFLLARHGQKLASAEINMVKAFD